MYYPIGLPKRLKFPGDDNSAIKSLICNRDRVLFAIITTKSLWIWFSRPCVPLACYELSDECIETYGCYEFVEWRPDSSMVIVKTSKNFLLYYSITIGDGKHFSYEQEDSNNPALRRESAELYTRERIPSVTITKRTELQVSGGVTFLVCLRDELMVATANGQIQRLRWDGTVHIDYCIDLRRVPFCDDQLVMKAIPLDVPGAHVIHFEYSPLVGGFAAVLNDGRAAFLTASTLKFDPNAVQGIWAKELDDATCTAINHKYRLLAYGRSNSQGIVYMIDEGTGGLEVSHRLVLSDRDYSGSPGAVEFMKWSPDGTVLALCWRNGGISLWSVFGSLLTASLRWDYSENPKSKPLHIPCMEWGAEGYEMWCVQCSSESLQQPAPSGTVPPPEVSSKEPPSSTSTSVLILAFLKSALSVNPCMSRLERVLLQGSDRLYLSTCEGVLGLSSNVHPDPSDPLALYDEDDDDDPELDDHRQQLDVSSNKQWIVIQIPYTYTGANWPMRYTCVDDSGEMVGVAGRNGVAHYSLKSRKWHLFGNESQEEDVVVTGGLVWWRKDWLVFGAYNIPANADEIRLYPCNHKLDNEFVTTVPQPSQVLLINIFNDYLIVLTGDCHITVYNLIQPQIKLGGNRVSVTRVQEVDISGLTVHPACVVSVALTSLRTESRLNSSQPVPPPAQSIIFSISGKILMIQRDSMPSDNSSTQGKLFQSAQMTPIVIASCCECLWYSNHAISKKPHLNHALWLHCGAHGTLVWLPLFPKDTEKSHNFMARRIMLPFAPSIYPLTILFEDGIMLGAETDTSLIGCGPSSLHQPVTVVDRTSEVYVHHLLRQLLRRNLGYHAWEVANTCRNLPYFPHALELLLHQVLEEEATSKDPLPDSLLPRVLEFISEFPVYLLTIVQCARKTELALWRYLFYQAGSPRHLFIQALDQGQLDTAASYLIILQNLESASVSRSHATKLLDATLEAAKWDLSNDLIRFLRSIEPSDLESPRACPSLSDGSTKVGFCHATPPVSPQCADEDLSMILPNTQALRGRSYSTTSGPPKMSILGEGVPLVPPRPTSDGVVGGPQRKRSSNSTSKDVATAEEYYINVILQRHAKKLLVAQRLRALGTMTAHLNFPLVAWLRRERCRAASIEDFVAALKAIHSEFSWPFPTVPVSHIRRYSVLSMGSLASPDDSLITPEEGLHRLSISVPKESSLGTGEIGDSGYLSHTTGTCDTQAALTPQHTLHTTPMHSLSLTDIPHQALLVPHSPAPGEIMSVMSEEMSLMGEDTASLCGDWTPDDPTRDLLSRPPDPMLHPRPPPHAEVQLRYLLQILLEASCLEWSIVVAVALRDAMAVLRVVTMAPDATSPVLIRLTRGLHALALFSNTQCLGYQSFFAAIIRQIRELDNLSRLRETALVIGTTNEASQINTDKIINSNTNKVSRPTSITSTSNSQTARNIQSNSPSQSYIMNDTKGNKLDEQDTSLEENLSSDESTPLSRSIPVSNDNNNKVEKQLIMQKGSPNLLEKCDETNSSTIVEGASSTHTDEDNSSCVIS